VHRLPERQCLSSTALRLGSSRTPASGHPHSWVEALKHCSGCRRWWHRTSVVLSTMTAREGRMTWTGSKAREGVSDRLEDP
jgi:hypothetical protein